MKQKVLFLILLVVFCSLPAFAQTKKIFVSVSVESKDTKLRDTIESYITRELRTLGDVEIDNSFGFFKVDILAIENEIDGEALGYTISVVISHFSTCTSKKITVKGQLETWNCYVQQDHFLKTDAVANLRKMCERIVTDFDTRVLKPMRAVK
ncbi:MAG: hypothetical protein ABWZ66_13755 [Pyrinomonadaceae bacterium]